MKVTGTTLYGQTKDFTLMLDYILGDETIATVAGGVITGLKVGQTPFKFNFLDEGFVEGTITVVEP